MALIPATWLSNVEMKRVICHWTAGGHVPSENDLDHYHILIDGEGKLHRGTHSIADNVATNDGDYAAHTKGTNTGAIGISMCCMLDAKESPFKPGDFPMKKLQWDTMVKVAAELCKRYDIKVTPTTVLGHGEVQKNIGTTQNGKWDPMKLPFDAGLTQPQVGSKLRSEVGVALAAL